MLRQKVAMEEKKGRELQRVPSSASWRLKRLAGALGCSLAGAVERLALEADDRYQGNIREDCFRKRSSQGGLSPATQEPLIPSGDKYLGGGFSTAVFLERISCFSDRFSGGRY